MSARQAICIVVDGLRAGALGTFGNTTSATPQLDELASRSTVVEWLWADSPHLTEFYRSVWQGVHALRKAAPAGQRTVLELLAQAGIRRLLITDEPTLAEQPGPERFDKVVCVETATERPAEEISETALGQFCSAALERLAEWQNDSAGGLTWLHTRGLFGPWDAPLGMRAEQLDEEDPPPAEFLMPPAKLHGVDDPDVLLVHRAAYAAQVAVVDACLGALFQAIDDAPRGETLVMLLGSRGFALGEHGNLGSDCRELYSERLHLPWLLHECGDNIPRPRLAGLAQPTDVGATLLEWFGVETGETASDGRSVLASADALRQLAVAGGDDGERSIRTPAWLLRQTGGDSLPQLFAKPDDRWEANDVAIRCPLVVEHVQAVLADFEQCCRDGRPLPADALDEELVTPSR